MNKKKGKIVFFIGLAIFIISYFLPVNVLNSFTNLKPTGLTSMFLCPIVGIAGIIFSIKEKDKFFTVANLILILLLPLSIFAGHIIGLE